MNTQVSRVLATLALTSALFTQLGVLAVPLGLTLLLSFSRVPRPLGVAYAQAATAVFISLTSLGPLLLAEAGVLLALAGTFETTARATIAVSLAGVLGVTWLYGVWPLTHGSLAALSFLVVAAIGLYAQHRYELVRLDLVTQ